MNSGQPLSSYVTLSFQVKSEKLTWTSLFVSFISGKNLGGKKMSMVRLESLWTPVWSRTLAEWKWLWVMMSLTHQCLSLLLSWFCRDCFCENFKKSLWLASAGSYQQPVSLFVLLPLGSFSFLDYDRNTDSSLLSSFVLIMLAHSAVQQYNHSVLGTLSDIVLPLSVAVRPS